MPKLPGVNHLDAVRVLEKLGFRIARDAGLTPDEFRKHL